MKHVIEHQLSDAEARAAAEEAIAHYGERFSNYRPSVVWETDKRATISFEAKGVKVRGSVELKPRAVEIDLDVPWAFRVFQGTAKRALEAEFRKFLDARAAKNRVAVA